ncbi:hypothetical protein [Mesorhizobium sp.]|uniref:hypothetical protein n=1 Tax=Mesorhizobium sp. TaxID=1871066 RepID=UPI00121A70CC|nr:hypothetical protein [Mesorhizobium sp.]TIP12112.1 MAG: hypothetical protein E5X73_13270 [Mesorhizobium sp.]
MQTLRKSRLIVQFARVLATTVKMTAVVSITAPQAINIAHASKYDLPTPYVSRALDAVLIPINHASRHRYQIPPKLRGVYVLAVAPMALPHERASDRVTCLRQCGVKRFRHRPTSTGWFGLRSR